MGTVLVQYLGAWTRKWLNINKEIESVCDWITNAWERKVTTLVYCVLAKISELVIRLIRYKEYWMKMCFCHRKKKSPDATTPWLTDKANWNLHWEQSNGIANSYDRRRAERTVEQQLKACQKQIWLSYTMIQTWIPVCTSIPRFPLLSSTHTSTSGQFRKNSSDSFNRMCLQCTASNLSR